MELSELKKDGAIELNVNISHQTLNVNSKVLMANDTFILVPKIVLQEKTVGFTDDCKIDLFTVQNNKPIIWENVIIKPVSYKGEIYHKIDATSSGKLYNRRDAFRTYVGLEVPMKMDSSYIDDVFLVLLKDLSENGCAIISEEIFQVNDHLHISLRDNDFTLDLKANIIRTEKKEDLGKTLYACKLLDTPIKLGKYLAKKQNEKLKTR